MRLPCFAVLVATAGGAPSGIEWPENRLLPAFAEVESLQVIDVRREPGEVQLMLACLQGLVNREKLRLYLIDHSEEGSETWLRELKVPIERSDDPVGLVRRFREVVKGLVIYDPALSDSVNVATTLAGQRDALVVSPAWAERLAAEGLGFKVVTDLRGRFSNRLEAYRWQFEHLRAGANPRLLVGLAPGHGRRTRNGLPLEFEEVAVEGSAVRDGGNRRERTLDLSRFLGGEAVYLHFQDASPGDGWGAAVGRVRAEADGEVIAEFTGGRGSEAGFLHDPQRSQVDRGGFRFADQGRHFTYRLPVDKEARRLEVTLEMWNQFRVSAAKVEPRMPWRPFGRLRDYAVANRAMVCWLDANAPAERELLEEMFEDAGPGTPYVGWFGNDIEGEFAAVEVASSHGVYVVPADWFNNLTVFSGTRPRVPAPEGPETPEPARRIYVTFTFGEGDNLQYNQHRMRVLWDDPARGRVPINWSSTPLLLDAAPVLLDFYRRTATPNDLLVSGPSSVGYFYPDPWPTPQLADFLRSTRPYVERSGMTIPYVLNRVDHRDRPLRPDVVRAYRDAHDVPGILLGWGERFGTRFIEEVPVSEVRGISSVEEGVAALQQARRRWDGDGPEFLSVGLFAWRLTPSDVVAIVDQLGDEFEVVTADRYFALMRKVRAESR